jgi:hypothetical protein
MAPGFRKVVGERRAEAFDRWLEAAKGGEVAEMKGFAQGLSKDYEAVSRQRSHTNGVALELKARSIA